MMKYADCKWCRPGLIVSLVGFFTALAFYSYHTETKKTAPETRGFSVVEEIAGAQCVKWEKTTQERGDFIVKEGGEGAQFVRCVSDVPVPCDDKALNEMFDHVLDGWVAKHQDREISAAYHGMVYEGDGTNQDQCKNKENRIVIEFAHFRAPPPQQKKPPGPNRAPNQGHQL